ncbi:hypothetical protein EJ08DRAFT_675960 [Tothia fuscella]|uniref:Uncharacterized protein n=1 Tax=Tothia fuscella TaxID=1048955 RepID=A0A9P4NZ91_9PEZI|nr:hypothetical protein EJ08DRAFT_675960 [Tothia fuscella]
MAWQGTAPTNTGGYPAFNMYYGALQQPDFPPNGEIQKSFEYPNSTMEYYQPFNLDEGEIDEDDEHYFQQQDAEEERQRALAAENGANQYRLQQSPVADLQGNTALPHPTIVPAKQDMAKNEEKAALLRAKLLEKRATNSRGPDSTAKAGISQPPPIAEKQKEKNEVPVVEASSGPGSDVDNLLKEAREAAELEAQKNRPYYYDSGGLQASMAVKDDGKASPAASTMSANPEPAVTPAATKKTKKEAKKAKQQAAMLTVSKEQQATAGAPKRVSTPAKAIGSGTGKQTVSKAQAKAETPVKAIAEKPVKKANGIKNEGTPKARSNTGIVETAPIKTPSRSETVLSASTIQPDTTPNQGIMHSERTALISTQRTQKADEAAQSSRDNAVTDTAAAHSHHFDDLDEWLEITGYHDRGNRDRVLTLHRRKADLERQMAELHRELEQTAVHRGRSLRLQPIYQEQSLPSPMAPPPAQFCPKATSAGAAKKSETSSSALSVSTKRPRSTEPESAAAGPEQINKMRRLSSTSSSKIGSVRPTGSNSLEVPSGPRRKPSISGDGLHVRGSGEDIPAIQSRKSAPEAARYRARSASPLHARRTSSSSYNDRTRYTTREPSPAPRSNWNVYRRPDLYEPHTSTSTRGGRGGGSLRGGRYSEGGSSYIGEAGRGSASQQRGSKCTQYGKRRLVVRFSGANFYIANDMKWFRTFSPKAEYAGHATKDKAIEMLVRGDWQEIEVKCGREWCRLIDEEAKIGDGGCSNSYRGYNQVGPSLKSYPMPISPGEIALPSEWLQARPQYRSRITPLPTHIPVHPDGDLVQQQPT